MPKYRFTSDDVIPVVKLVGGMLDGIPPHLSVAACLMLSFAMVNGRAVSPEKVGKFVEDFSMLLEMWEMEVMQ